MKSLIVCLISLVFVQTSAAQQSTVSGQVRLSGGLAVAGAQVMLFDLTDLQRGPVAQATTDENGQFALPLVALGGTGLPQRFAVGQNYPNPFNPSTIIPYQLPTAVQVRLEIFNLLGQHVATLVDEEQPAGFHTAQWDATNAARQAVAAGMYLYRLTAGDEHYTRRMVLVDGQAGGHGGVGGPSMGKSLEAAERAYGIAVAGVGLAAYVDADFRVEAGMAPIELVVEPEALPAREKVVPSGLVGDVNADGRIDPADALLVMLYGLESSRVVAHSGPRFLGDVNADSRIDPADALLIMAYVANPFDKTLPARLGQPVGIAGKRVASPSRSVVFILDVSGSMEDEVEGGGETRLNVAQAALSQVLRQAATDGSQEYALTTFGERGGCSVDVPIAFTNNPQRVVSYASGLSPNRGRTPLAEALLRGERLVLDTALSDDILLVLLSDGQESCDGDPVAVARAIKERGEVGSISVNAIGFGVEPGSDAEQQLRAVAQAGGGDYFRASETADLAAALFQASDITPPGSFFEKPTRSEKVVIDGIEVEAAENEILVFLDEDVSSAEIRDAQAEILNQGGSVKSLNFDLRTIQVGITDAIVEQDFINALSRQSGVSGANVNGVVIPDRSFIKSNDEGYRQWRTRFPNIPLAKVPTPTPVSFFADFWINDIEAMQAWQALSKITLVPNVIGIVDSGFPASQNILNSSRISRYTQEGKSLSGDDSPDATHGLYVTGFAAGYEADLRGVNPHSDVVFIDFDPSLLSSLFPRIYQTDLQLSIKTAIDKGAGVVNISLGDGSDCFSPDPSLRPIGRRLWRSSLNGVVNYARKHDVLLVWSAGNNCEKRDDRLLPRKRFGLGSEDVANTDSWLSHTLIVGASTMNQKDACFSSMGEVVNIMAPGAAVAFSKDFYGNGTSFAAPMVTGAAGLVRSIESSISAEETRSILVNSSKNVIMFDTNCERDPYDVGEVASSPTGLLNLNSAIQSSLVAHGVELVTSGDVYLSKGQTQSVQIDVTVPAGGAHAIDVGFIIDQSGSYEDDITTLQTRAQDIVNSLRARTDIDVQFGLAGFADFPQGDYGDAGDIEYRLYQNITGDSDALIAAIDKLNKPLMNGADYPESQYEALFRAAQEIGWRDGTLRILLLATDADFHDSDTDPSYPGTGRRAVLATLEEENVIVIGLQSGDEGDAEDRLQELAEATGGSVLSLDAASSQIVDAIVRGLDAALADVDVRLDVLAGQSWLTGISPTVHEGVDAGQTVSFTVSLEGQRDPSVEDLPYNVYIWARGDGAALLSRTKIPIIVSKE